MKWNNKKKITKKFQWERLEFSTWNPESTAWNPQSKTVMDSLARGETKEQEIKYIFNGSFTSSVRVCHVMSHVSMFFFRTKPSWLWFFIFNLLDINGASNPGYSTVQTIRNWDVAKERLLLSFILSKGYKVKFLKSFDKKRDVIDKELEKHFRLEIVPPKNSAASSLNSPSRTLVETYLLSIVYYKWNAQG